MAMFVRVGDIDLNLDQVVTIEYGEMWPEGKSEAEARAAGEIWIAAFIQPAGDADMLVLEREDARALKSYMSRNGRSVTRSRPAHDDMPVVDI